MTDEISPLDREKLKIERLKIRADVGKWLILAAGAVASFFLLDLGRLNLDRFRADAENERALLSSYLAATSEVTPEIWKRKLRLLSSLTQDEEMRKWAKKEMIFIEQFAALDTLYRETLVVASQLTDPATLNTSERAAARTRFEQLYWADLPFAGESQPVAEAMISFRNRLNIAEITDSWASMQQELIKLAQELREAVRTLPDIEQPAIPN